MSCMYQTDAELVHDSHITGDAVVINQCDDEGYAEYATQNGTVRMFHSTGRGLTKSRNMAIAQSRSDVCILCDDDEVYVDGYEQLVLQAYEALPQADIIVFNMTNRPSTFSNHVRRLHFPLTMKVSSWQISFRRKSLLRTGVRFDELMGAGTDNGAEEEFRFLTDCEKARLKIYYYPVAIASVAQKESTWFDGFTELFFENRGATTRYIMGAPLAFLYAVYYVIRKKNMYSQDISPWRAFTATLRGILENKISKQRKELESRK